MPSGWVPRRVRSVFPGGAPGCDAGLPLPAAVASVPPQCCSVRLEPWGQSFLGGDCTAVAGPWGELPGGGDRLAGNTSRRCSGEGLCGGGVPEEQPWQRPELAGRLGRGDGKRHRSRGGTVGSGGGEAGAIGWTGLGASPMGSGPPGIWGAAPGCLRWCL